MRFLSTPLNFFALSQFARAQNAETLVNTEATILTEAITNSKLLSNFVLFAVFLK